VLADELPSRRPRQAARCHRLSTIGPKEQVDVPLPGLRVDADDKKGDKKILD
jgi:hypothetical protein